MLATFAAALRMKERIAGKMLKQPGIHGVGVGMKNPKNHKDGAAIIIYTGKISASSLGIPSTLALTHQGRSESVPVRLIQTGKFKAHVSAAQAELTRRIRPVPAGYSVGTEISSGTAGLIVTNFPRRNRLFLFSNNHVLNLDNTARLSTTLQPGGADDGIFPRDSIGRLGRFVKLRGNQPNYLDAALSIPFRNSLLSPRYVMVGIVPGHVTSYRVGERFKKVGRTTGLRFGTVESIHTDIQVDYSGYDNLGVLTFKNQSVIRGARPVSLPGDSGSVWLRRKDNFAAAVNYAGTTDGRLSIAYPVQWFIQVFKVRVAHPRGTGKTKQLRVIGKRYTRPLSARELTRIRVMTAKMG